MGMQGVEVVGWECISVVGRSAMGLLGTDLSHCLMKPAEVDICKYVLALLRGVLYYT